MDLIKFNYPIYLYIGAFAVLASWFLQIRNTHPPLLRKRKVILKFIVICLIIAGLSEPMLLIRTGDQSLIFAVDISQSINDLEKKATKDYIALKIKEKKR